MHQAGCIYQDTYCPAPERGNGRGGLGSCLPAVLPYTPRSRDRSREAGSSKGDTHIWVLRAQCWLRGGEAWGREERQRNRRTGLSPEGLRPTPSQARHQAGWRGSSVDTQGPWPPQHPQYANVASRETICGLLGPAPDPNHAVHPG